jgi:hypothetical protein
VPEEIIPPVNCKRFVFIVKLPALLIGLGFSVAIAAVYIELRRKLELVNSTDSEASILILPPFPKPFLQGLVMIVPPLMRNKFLVFNVISPALLLLLVFAKKPVATLLKIPCPNISVASIFI